MCNKKKQNACARHKHPLEAKLKLSYKCQKWVVSLQLSRCPRNDHVDLYMFHIITVFIKLF